MTSAYVLWETAGVEVMVALPDTLTVFYRKALQLIFQQHSCF